MQDPYQVLGVNEQSTDQDIKQAFRKLAVKYHPDRGGDENKFKEINEAYDKIKTQEKRQQYEAAKQFGGDGFNFNFSQGDPFDMQDMFAQFFGDGFKQSRRYQRRPVNKNIQVNIQISLEEAYHGTKKFIQIDQTSKEVEINIPKGIDHGQSVRYKGLGMKNIPNTPPGDLIVKIHIVPHKVFTRKKLDLYSELSINCFEAINGTHKDVITIDGSSIKLKIREGTQPGTVMRVPEHGMETANQVGDHFIRVNVSIPKNLTQEDKDEIRRIQQAYS